MKQCLVLTDIHNQPIDILAEHANNVHIKTIALADLLQMPGIIGDPLHQHLFAKDGMTHACKALRARMQNRQVDCALGFSAGGTLLWRAVRNGLRAKRLFCVAATRLRHETGPLAIPTHLYFGADDPGLPDRNHLQVLSANCLIAPDAAHAFYTDPDHPLTRHLTRDIVAALDLTAREPVPHSLVTRR